MDLFELSNSAWISTWISLSSTDREAPKTGEVGLEHGPLAQKASHGPCRITLEGYLLLPCPSSAISLASPVRGGPAPNIPLPWLPPTPLPQAPSLLCRAGETGVPPSGLLEIRDHQQTPEEASQEEPARIQWGEKKRKNNSEALDGA